MLLISKKIKWIGRSAQSIRRAWRMSASTFETKTLPGVPSQGLSLFGVFGKEMNLIQVINMALQCSNSESDRRLVWLGHP
jgi:hypothetical protein